MAMNRYYPITQGYIWVARLSDTVTDAAAPAADSTDWLKLGEAVNGSIGTEVETKERTKIVLGQRLKVESIIRETFTMKVSIEELNKLVFDLVFRSDETATNAFISHGAQGRKAWVRYQGYDEADDNNAILQGLALVKPSGDVPLFGEDFFKADFDMSFEGKLSGQLIGSYTT